MLELQRNLDVLKRWWWLLVLGALVGGAVAFSVSKHLAKNEYEAVAMVSSGAAQGSSGPYFAAKGSDGGGDLLVTGGMVRALQRQVPGVSSTQLIDGLTGSVSEGGCVLLAAPQSASGCRLLFLHVKWADPTTAIRLANAVATIFMQQERVRLEAQYSVDHRARVAEEQMLARSIRTTPGSGAAQNWLQSQYANTLSSLYSQDTQSRIQTSEAETSLYLAQPARSATKMPGSKTKSVAGLGALVGLIAAWLIAFLATTSYPSAEETNGPRPVLSRVRD